MERIDVTIAGGGIIGLSIAYALLKKFPKLSLALIEKEIYFGDHSSGRNSGVLHAGIYYPTGSLKHKHCISGNQIWRSWVEELGVALNSCGKYIVATSEEQQIEIEKIFQHASNNRVPGLRWAEGHEIEMLQEYTNSSKAFFSPSTGILDVSEAIQKLAQEVESRGAMVVRGTSIQGLKSNGLSGVDFRVQDDQLNTRVFVNAAGLGGVALRKQLGLLDLEDKFVRGHYLKTTQKYYTESLIYPIPEKNLKGLGVHTTFDIEKNLRFGPDTMDVNEIKYDMPQSLFDSFIPAIQKTFKNINTSLLQLDYSGIRPKIMKNGELHTDFWMKGPKELSIPGYFELCGIESPGLTAAPSIAESLLPAIHQAVEESLNSSPRTVL